jgi:hypothetical protein
LGARRRSKSSSSIVKSASLPNLSSVDAALAGAGGGDYLDSMIQDDIQFWSETGVMFARSGGEESHDDEVTINTLQHLCLSINTSYFPCTHTHTPTRIQHQQASESEVSQEHKKHRTRNLSRVSYFYNATMLQCYNATMLQCYNATMLQCYNATMLR